MWQSANEIANLRKWVFNRRWLIYASRIRWAIGWNTYWKQWTVSWLVNEAVFVPRSTFVVAVWCVETQCHSVRPFGCHLQQMQSVLIDEVIRLNRFVNISQPKSRNHLNSLWFCVCKLFKVWFDNKTALLLIPIHLWKHRDFHAEPEELRWQLLSFK